MANVLALSWARVIYIYIYMGKEEYIYGQGVGAGGGGKEGIPQGRGEF